MFCGEGTQFLYWHPSSFAVSVHTTYTYSLPHISPLLILFVAVQTLQTFSEISSFSFVFCLCLFFTVIVCPKTPQPVFCTYSVKGRSSWSSSSSSSPSFSVTLTSCANKIPACRKQLQFFTLPVSRSFQFIRLRPAAVSQHDLAFSACIASFSTIWACGGASET